MIISGVVLASRPEHLAEVGQALDTIPWAEVHFIDPKGRLVVIIEAADLEQSADRLKELQEIPRVLTADLAQYFIEEGVRDPATARANARGGSLLLPPLDPKGRRQNRDRVRKFQPWRQ